MYKTAVYARVNCDMQNDVVKTINNENCNR